jgi:uncharacterized protein YbjT (DUF2867 family)
MSTKTVLVMRATGAQGKGAISHLVKSGWKIHALVSDASSDRAVALKSFGEQVSLYQGTWKNPSSIENALKGCQALLLNQVTSYTDDAELQEARVVLKLSKEAGVQHVAFPTSLPLNNPNVKERYEGSPVAPGVLNKGDVEELVKASGLTWTLLRPGYFTTNLLAPILYWMFPEIKEGKVINSYGPDCIMTLVDPDDTGAFIAAAFEDPARFGGQIITVVSENVRFDEMMSEFSEASGMPLEIVYRTAEETEKEKNNAFVAGQVLCRGLDKYVDMDEVKSWGIPLTTFKQFLQKRKKELPNGKVSRGDQSSATSFAKSMVQQRGA